MRIDGLRDERPADKAGMMKGDVVLKMGDLDITDMETYMQALAKFEPGETITIVFERDGKKVEKKLTFD